MNFLSGSTKTGKGDEASASFSASGTAGTDDTEFQILTASTVLLVHLVLLCWCCDCVLFCHNHNNDNFTLRLSSIYPQSNACNSALFLLDYDATGQPCNKKTIIAQSIITCSGASGNAVLFRQVGVLAPSTVRLGQRGQFVCVNSSSFASLSDVTALMTSSPSSACSEQVA